MAKDEKSKYYDAGGIQVYEVIKKKLTPEQFKGFLLGSIIKYSLRYNFKHQTPEEKMRDIEKIHVYSGIMKDESGT